MCLFLLGFGIRGKIYFILIYNWHWAKIVCYFYKIYSQYGGGLCKNILFKLNYFKTVSTAR